MTTQEECVEGKEEETNSAHEENDVSNRHMTWWQRASWIRVDNGPHLRTARGRRRTWRAATRAVQETHVAERIEEVQTSVNSKLSREDLLNVRTERQHTAAAAAPTQKASATATVVMTSSSAFTPCWRTRTTLRC